MRVVEVSEHARGHGCTGVGTSGRVMGGRASGNATVGNAGNCANGGHFHVFTDTATAGFGHRRIKGLAPVAADIEPALAKPETGVGDGKGQGTDAEQGRVGPLFRHAVHIDQGFAGVRHGLVFQGHAAHAVETAVGVSPGKVSPRSQATAIGKQHLLVHLLPLFLAEALGIGRKENGVEDAVVVDQVGNPVALQNGLAFTLLDRPAASVGENARLHVVVEERAAEVVAVQRHEVVDELAATLCGHSFLADPLRVSSKPIQQIESRKHCKVSEFRGWYKLLGWGLGCYWPVNRTWTSWSAVGSVMDSRAKNGSDSGVEAVG